MSISTFPSAEDYAIARALATGDLRGISEATQLLFAQSGLAHALSASGFHLVAIAACVAGIARLGLRPFAGRIGIRGRKLAEASAVAGVALAFTLATGRAAPTVRALAALAFVSAATLGGRALRTPLLLLMTALFAWAFGRGGLLSLALSLSAVAAIVFAPAILPGGTRRARELGALTFLPWLATLPLIATAFHSVSLVSPLANLALSPWLAIFSLLPGLLAFALRELGGESLAGPFWTFAAAGAGVARIALAQVAEAFPLALWVRKSEWTIAWLLLAGVLVFARGRNARILLVIGILAGARLCGFLEGGRARALVLDAGQGDSIALFAPKLPPFLVDTGASGRAPFPGTASLSLADTAAPEIAGILLSHPDADHAGGIASVLLRHSVAPGGALWLRREHLEFRSARKALRAAERHGLPVRFLDDAGEIYPGLACRALGTEARDSNDSSPLCKFSFGDGRALLLTGDMSAKAEREYARLFPEFARATHLKVAHHGSSSSSDPLFLAAVGAEHALLSLGAGNRYGHPTRKTLTALAKYGMRPRRTDEEGTISLP